MHILHNHTFLYIVYTFGKMKSLVPHVFKSMTYKKITLFPKKQEFLKHTICLINKINQVWEFYIITPFIGCAHN